MARRLHIPVLHAGLVMLDDVQAHHARNVLRLENRDAVELFDDDGRTASGELEIEPTGHVAVRIAVVNEPAESRFTWSVAAAVPKGERADWMVEKLSELGAASYIPLLAERSVVQPKGEGKRQRWIRLATESAKQSRRIGVMRVEEPIELNALLKSLAAEPGSRTTWFLDTGDTAVPIRQLLLAPPPTGHLLLLIGPEGGWAPGEIDRMLSGQLTAVSLTRTILRIETAAIAAAACVASCCP